MSNTKSDIFVNLTKYSRAILSSSGKIIPSVQYNFLAILHLSGLDKITVPKLKFALINFPGFMGNLVYHLKGKKLENKYLIKSQRYPYPPDVGYCLLKESF
jgi:hypothetical protein